ncbi:hypothetical protein E2C01_030249 [Portunus trituberculatus]|uniref:Uncharacterized protein n=1 Tax=Portunus trituberculatus TaxID=210409 RepID=A0A5B7EPY5_PORTR|nr:hypothetical protein [Portunus trituberculatus]
MAGFKKTGIYPLDPSAYDTQAFDPSLFKLYRTLADTRDEIPESSQKPATPNKNRPKNFSATPSTSHAFPSTSATRSTSTSRPTQDQATPSTSKDALPQCTSSQDQATPSTFKNVSSSNITSPGSNFEETLASAVSSKKTPTTDAGKKPVRRRILPSARVITSDEFVEEIQKREMEVALKQKGKRKKCEDKDEDEDAVEEAGLISASESDEEPGQICSSTGTKQKKRCNTSTDNKDIDEVSHSASKPSAVLNSDDKSSDETTPSRIREHYLQI